MKMSIERVLLVSQAYRLQIQQVKVTSSQFETSQESKADIQINTKGQLTAKCWPLAAAAAQGRGMELRLNAEYAKDCMSVKLLGFLPMIWSVLP